VHVFSKTLQFLNYEELGEVAAEIGFDGIDLTVRTGGHVEPDKVSEDLPRAMEWMGKAGIKIRMMTTAINDPESVEVRKVLEQAAQLGISYYRTGYFRYRRGESIPESIAYYQRQARLLSKLNRRFNIVGGYHNHSGNYMGASIWEL